MSGHPYIVAGLRLASERPLPLLPLAGLDGGAPDIQVRFGPLAPLEGRAAGPFRVQSERCVELLIRERLRVRISNGTSLDVDAPEDMRAAEWQTYLFGPAFAALLYQRGELPLHAGAVRVGVGAVAVAGASGQGKSTTIRALLRAGCSFLTDDQLVLSGPDLWVEPGVPSLKLWRAAAAVFDDPAGDSARVADGVDKFHVPVVATPRVPLRAICILARDADAPLPRLERLSPPHAVAALGGLAHHAYVADAMGRRAVIFRHAARLADRIPVFILRRPDDLSRLGCVAERVMEVAGTQAPCVMERA